MDSERVKSRSGYNHKVDIWSLGCMALFMITGKQPWDENHQMTIYYKVAILLATFIAFIGVFMLQLGLKNIPFVPEVGSTPRMTKEARDFIIDCLTVNPSERPESMDLLSHNFVKLRNR